MALVQMKNAEGHEVDVHPDMVGHYKAGGYEVIEAAKPAPKRKAK